MTQLRFISDAGHGWLEVPESLYKKSGIVASRFSYYSVKKKMVYLEEDCDISKFFAIMPESEFKIVCVNDGNSSPIRNMSRMPGV